METRKQKLERQLKDLYDLQRSVRGIDQFIYMSVNERIDELEKELNDIPFGFISSSSLKILLAFSVTDIVLMLELNCIR